MPRLRLAHVRLPPEASRKKLCPPSGTQRTMRAKSARHNLAHARTRRRELGNGSTMRAASRRRGCEPSASHCRRMGPVPNDILAVLRRAGLLDFGDEPTGEPLTGGVSSDIWRVDLPPGRSASSGRWPSCGSRPTGARRSSATATRPPGCEIARGVVPSGRAGAAVRWIGPPVPW